MKGEDQISGVAIVCVLEKDDSGFHDNAFGSCHFCDRRVQHRPDIPTPHTLVCRICFADRIEDGDVVAVTPRSIVEMIEFVRRN